MSRADITTPPKRNAKDVARTLVKAGLAAVPCVGGSASELFSLVVTPSFEKRRDGWVESIAIRLKELEDRFEKFKLENLRDNESFLSVFVEASQAAIRNHQEEKLEALRNAVLNAALPTDVDDDLQLIFLRVINSLTPGHLRILKKLDTFHNRVRKTPGIMRQRKLRLIFPEWEKQEFLYRLIVHDLHSHGLITFPSLDGLVIPPNSFCLPNEPLADLGEKFLKFIAQPGDDPK